jgi:MarR family transcriptional regulator, lower aerobic nicotinate degradation pathway regulator
MSPEPDAAGTSPFVDALVELSFAVQEVLTRAAGEHDLSVTQLRLLGVLRDRTPTMAAIARHLGLDPSSVSGLIDRAERRGLVSRSTSTHDARVTIISVTSTGRDVGMEIAAAVTARLEALVGHATGTERDVIVRFAESVMTFKNELRPDAMV